MLIALRFKLFGCILALALVAGCAPVKVHDVNDTAVRTNKSAVTQDDVAGAIKRAGNALGWAMLDEAPGKMTGTLRLRTHVAVVGVDYDPSKYSIRYKDSTNLRYDAETGVIHKNYNSWIQNLDAAIQRELANLP
jgi:hypothetical protein